MIYTTPAFWKATAERAIKTAAQAGALAIGADLTNVMSLDWARFAGFMAFGALASVLTSIASAKIGATAGPSLAGEVLASTPPPAPAAHVVPAEPLDAPNEDYDR